MSGRWQALLQRRIFGEGGAKGGRSRAARADGRLRTSEVWNRTTKFTHLTGHIPASQAHALAQKASWEPQGKPPRQPHQHDRAHELVPPGHETGSSEEGEEL